MLNQIQKKNRMSGKRCGVVVFFSFSCLVSFQRYTNRQMKWYIKQTTPSRDKTKRKILRLSLKKLMCGQKGVCIMECNDNNTKKSV